MHMSKDQDESREKNKTTDSRALLLEAAKKVFAKLGYDGATVKDLADEAGVNISLVSYYFKGKEGLYRECIETFGISKLAFVEKILTPPQSFEEMKLKLSLWLEHVLETHVEEPEITTIIHRECESHLPIAKDIFERTFQKTMEKLMNFFVESQKAGLFRKEFEPRLFGLITFSGVIHIASHQHLLEEFFDFDLANPEVRKKIVHMQVEGILRGCLEQ